MKSPEQIKGAIRNIAKEKNLFAQEVLQIYMFERLIERLSLSKYKDNFILKGGLLISSMIGIGERTTMDMDTTVKGIEMDEEIIRKTMKEIISIDVKDNINFIFYNIEPIREDDEYNNYCVSILAEYGKMKIPMKIDITTGDEITPKEIKYKYQFMFDEKSVSIMAYPLETILAEKYETIIRRNIANTRARDFYDLYVLYQLKKNVINWDNLQEAIKSTATKRNSLMELKDYDDILDEIMESNYMRNIWNNYQLDNTYSKDIDFTNIIQIAKELGKILNI